MYNNIISPVKSQPFSKEAAPYSSFARLYDVLLGNRMLPMFIRNFERLVRHYHIYFRAVADAACGTGSFARYLRQLNKPVFGVDGSSAMIEIAKRRHGDHGICFLIQDLRRLQLPCLVDLITCNYDALNYFLTVRDLSKVFLAFDRNLMPDGHLIFDMITDAWKEPGPNHYTEKIAAPGIFSFWYVAWNPRNRRRTVVMTNFIKKHDGAFRREREVHRERAYPISVICALLSCCGYRIRGVHDAYLLHPAVRQTKRAVFVVQKPQTAQAAKNAGCIHAFKPGL